MSYHEHAPALQVGRWLNTDEAIDLEGLNLVPGTVNTVFLVGTPLESAPIRAITVSTPSFGDM